MCPLSPHDTFANFRKVIMGVVVKMQNSKVQLHFSERMAVNTSSENWFTCLFVSISLFKRFFFCVWLDLLHKSDMISDGYML